MLGPGSRIHLVGIGGYGMSAIAKVLLEMGVCVTGSDVAESDVTAKLKELGARIHVGHDRGLVDGADLVVHSTAIPPDNPELVEARSRGITTIHRSEMLAQLFNQKRGIAVAGAHGKTTTTSMIALCLLEAGFDPTVLVGGEVPSLNGGAHYGAGDYLVAEADESDRSFLRYRPHLAVVTNIEADHLEYYEGKLEKLVATFEEFLDNIKPDGKAILCLDDPRVAAIRERLDLPVISYGLSASGVDYTASEIELHEHGSNFVCHYREGVLGEVRLAVPGRHNVLNALAAIAAAGEVGADFAAVCRALASFGGAKRRFQLVGNVAGVLVVDDYAHHPTEISATIRAAKDGWPGRRVIAVFQPQRYTRTHFLMNEFSRAFSEADEVILAPIYSPPPEKPIAGVSSERLAELIAAHDAREARLLPTHDAIVDYLITTSRPGDLVLTMGAGDIWKVARSLVERLGGESGRPEGRIGHLGQAEQNKDQGAAEPKNQTGRSDATPGILRAAGSIKEAFGLQATS